MVRCDGDEVRVGREHRQLESDAELGEQSVDGAELYSATPAVVPEVGGGDVIVAFGTQEGQGGEAVDDGGASARAAEALEELLEHQARREDRLAGAQSRAKTFHLGRCVWCIATQRERPHARVDEQAQSRDRSAL